MNSEQKFVEKYYQMDPRTEDFLFDGSHLDEGMVVLIETPSMRAPIEDDMDDETFEWAMRYNRWAMVVGVQMEPESNMVTFAACYEDGSKKKIRVATRYAWLVKDPNSTTAVGIARVREERNRTPWMSEQEKRWLERPPLPQSSMFQPVVVKPQDLEATRVDEYLTVLEWPNKAFSSKKSLAAEASGDWPVRVPEEPRRKRDEHVSDEDIANRL